MQLATTCRGKAKVIVSIASALTLTFVLMLLAPTAKPASPRSEAGINERYLSPIEMALSPNGRLLYVVCQASDELRVVELASGKIVSTVSVGHVPRGIVLSPDGRHIYVTNAWSDTVSLIDATTLRVVRTLPTGFE
ncbi:MAG: beta-propeller fold lactonase family protein, partial [Candidatus Sulfotelmatobacter sp.]